MSTSTLNTKTLEFALQLAKAGRPVFPAAVDKKPLITDWPNQASTDENQIREWFTDQPSLVGVPTGERSGFDVVDVDPRHGGDQWLDANQQLMATRWHKTRQGGVHLLFRHRDGMRGSVSKIAPGVDVRADGNYIVFWPAHGFPHSTSRIMEWPEDLAVAAMNGRAHRAADGAGARLDMRKPPSAQHAADLLDRMPNALEEGRDTYVEVMLAARGCICALTEEGAGELDDEANEHLIVDAAIRWANKWPAKIEDETEKWYDDWSKRDAPLAGWQTLTKIAGQLIPGYREEVAAEQFTDPPPVENKYQGNANWPNFLLRTPAGGVKPNVLMNAVIALRHAPEWQGVLAQNTFTDAVDLRVEPPYRKNKKFVARSLQDLDVYWVKAWLEKHHINVSQQCALSAIKMVAAENEYHPIVERLNGMTWDKVPRLDTWMVRLAGVEDTPLHRAYGARFLIQMIARVRQPGCKADCVPILEGPQGTLKSSLLRELSWGYFTDHMPDLANKDAQLQLQGCGSLNSRSTDSSAARTPNGLKTSSPSKSISSGARTG
jgi:hypothetical protein